MTTICDSEGDFASVDKHVIFMHIQATYSVHFSFVFLSIIKVMNCSRGLAIFIARDYKSSLFM